MTQRSLKWKALGLGILATGAVVIMAFFYTVAGGKLPFSGHKYTVDVEMRAPQQLLKHADVRAAGVKIGTVRNLRNRHGLADIKIELDKAIAPIYRDATVLIRQKTLVGENYIELTRGTPQAGVVPDGGTLSVSQAKPAVPIDDVLSTLTPETRRHVERSLRALGRGFSSSSPALSRIFGDLPPTLRDGSSVMSVLDGQRGQVASLVQQTGTVMQAIADRTNDMRSLIGSARTAATAVAARDARLADAIGKFPATLRQARESVTRLNAFAGDATPVVGGLRTSLRALKPVVHELTPTADAATALFRRLPAFISRTDPMLTHLSAFATSTEPALPALSGFFRQLNPFLAYLKPYSRDIGSALSNFGTPGAADKYGVMARCGCAFGDRSLSNWTPAMRKAVAPLLDYGLISDVQHIPNNALRKPGLLPKADTPFTGTYPRVEADK